MCRHSTIMDNKSRGQVHATSLCVRYTWNVGLSVSPCCINLHMPVQYIFFYNIHFGDSLKVLFIVYIYLRCHWRSNYQSGRNVITLTLFRTSYLLTYVCLSQNRDLDFQPHMSRSFLGSLMAWGDRCFLLLVVVVVELLIISA